MKRNSVPPFVVRGVEFQCWIVDDGSRYEWRDESGTRCAGRHEGQQTYWASRNGHSLERTFPTLKMAMTALV